VGRVSALFDSRADAERAITELRRIGVRDADLSVALQHEEGGAPGTLHGGGEIREVGSGAGKGAVVGAGVGALFGLATALLPGAGPLITAGALASLLGSTGGAMAAGAVVGGTTGAFAGALARAGFTKEEAQYYGSAVERGEVLVAVDAADVASEERVRSELRQLGGRTYAA
jgi:hypothetical protein